jgi:hypothetical protein
MWAFSIVGHALAIVPCSSLPGAQTDTGRLATELRTATDLSLEGLLVHGCPPPRRVCAAQRQVAPLPPAKAAMADTVGQNAASTLGLLRLSGEGLRIFVWLMPVPGSGITEATRVPVAPDSSWQSLYMLRCRGLPLTEEEQEDGNTTVTLEVTGTFQSVMPRPESSLRPLRPLPTMPFPMHLVQSLYPGYPTSGQDRGLVALVAVRSCVSDWCIAGRCSS